MQISTRGRIAAYGFSRKVEVEVEQRLHFTQPASKLCQLFEQSYRLQITLRQPDSQELPFSNTCFISLNATSFRCAKAFRMLAKAIKISCWARGTIDFS